MIPPILEYDDSKRSIIEPESKEKVPERMVLCFMNNVLKKFAQNKRWEIAARLKNESEIWPVYRILVNNIEIGITHPGIGSPLAAAHFEELIAMGAKKFIACGSAGALIDDISFDEFLVVESAVRDEGTSFHYLPPSREVNCSKKMVDSLTNFLQQNMIKYRKVKSWTTDGFYRETEDRILKRKKEGCSIVEMECSALFSVANFRNVEVVAILYTSDKISNGVWNNTLWNKNDIRERLLEVSINACSVI